MWGMGGAPSLSPDVALRGGRTGAGVLSEIGSSTSGSSLTGRAHAINLLLEECNRLFASEVMKRQHVLYVVCTVPVTSLKRQGRPSATLMLF